MSSKKDKYIESAQKFLIKGQLGKAVVDLEQAVALDPGDLKVRQRLAEVLVRVNRQTDAISHYDTIGKSFSNSGFYLKAIAVYKQIQKLDPENLKITLTLADLNVKHGLIGNALAEFSLVVNHYLKTGKQQDALDLLERMLEIDPSNLNTMLKTAETLLAAGNAETAYERYCNLAQQLWTRPDKSPFYRLCERIKTLFPDKGCAVLRFVTAQLERGETAEAFASLKEIITHSPDNFDAWMLLSDTVRASGDTRQLVSILEKIAQKFPGELRPKEELIELALSVQEIDRALNLLTEYKSLFIEKGRSDRLEDYYKEILSCAPSDERSLEKLCRHFEHTGDSNNLAAAKTRLLQLHNDQHKTAPAAVITVAIPEPEVKGAPRDEQKIEFPEPAGISDTMAFATIENDWEEEVELDLEEVTGEKPPVPSFFESIEFEPFPELPSEPHSIFEPLQGLQPDDVINSEASDEISAEHFEELEPIEELTHGHDERLSQVGFSAVTSDPLTRLDEPEEAISPELSSQEISVFDVASAEVSEADEFPSPNEDELTDRVLLEIAKPLPVSAFTEEEPIELPVELESETEPLSPWDEMSSDNLLSDGRNAPSVKAALPPAEELMDLLVNHLESFDWSATDNRGKAAASAPDEMELEILTESDEESTASPEAAFELEDLASFSEALFGEELSLKAEDPESEQYSLGNLLSAFRKGVDEQLDESDTESHYNLGIAYKEMGLFDEAIHEFRSAGQDPHRAADCIALQGICLKEKGDLASAETTFRQGLDLVALSSESLLNLKYELALLYEQANRSEEALCCYQEIAKVNHSYRDVSQHISRLSGEDDLDILIELKEEGD